MVRGPFLTAREQRESVSPVAAAQANKDEIFVAIERVRNA
jgi:hypothetical protein